MVEPRCRIYVENPDYDRVYLALTGAQGGHPDGWVPIGRLLEAALASEPVKTDGAMPTWRSPTGATSVWDQRRVLVVLARSVHLGLIAEERRDNASFFQAVPAEQHLKYRLILNSHYLRTPHGDDDEGSAAG